MRLIDIEAEVCADCVCRDKCDRQAYCWVKAMQTVDAVPVVHCKDCKYYRESRVLAPNKFCFRLNHPTEPGKIGYNFADDDFCSHGVRRNEGGQ